MRDEAMAAAIINVFKKARRSQFDQNKAAAVHTRIQARCGEVLDKIVQHRGGRPTEMVPRWHHY
ncbi:MAG: hypothetical protein JO166_04590 [Deltaproteobacteria bacterium]|nr:hypothetical protein [Deltaproteobacteria bacterium]